jgi:DNA topoisomerase-1
VVELLQTTLIRVGNDEYARANGAYGLTTLRNRHVRVRGNEVVFVFTGKSGLTHEVHAEDRRVARVVRQCQEIPGQRLFQYLDEEGRPVPVHSHDVNDYLRGAADVDMTAKDFRTWVATVLAARALADLEPPTAAREEQEAVRRVVAVVAEELGNTPAVARASYIHPDVLSSYATGALQEVWSTTPPRRARLTADERRTLALLRRTARRSPRRARATASSQGAAVRHAS